MVKEALAVCLVGRHLGEPYGGLDRLHLAEEGSHSTKRVMAPVLQQPSGFGRDVPIGEVRDHPPAIDATTYFVDDRRRVVLLVS